MCNLVGFPISLGKLWLRHRGSLGSFFESTVAPFCFEEHNSNAICPLWLLVLAFLEKDSLTDFCPSLFITEDPWIANKAFDTRKIREQMHTFRSRNHPKYTPFQKCTHIQTQTKKGTQLSSCSSSLCSRAKWGYAFAFVSSTNILQT